MSAFGTSALVVLVLNCVIVLARTISDIEIIRTAKSLAKDCDAEQRARVSARLVGVLTAGRRPWGYSSRRALAPGEERD